MLATELLPALNTYVARPAVRDAIGLASGASAALAFLAQGEYNINYRLMQGDQTHCVLRVNVGSQIGQAGGAQIAYEAAALRLLGPHGVAPRLLYVDDTLAALPYGLLAMEYLPGGPLDYASPAQIAAAAGTLARLHSIAAPPGAPFIRRRALHDDLAEGREWLAPYLACGRAPAHLRALFATLLERAAESAARDAGRFPAPFALVHTDVQAHNWIVSVQLPAGRQQQATDSGQMTHGTLPTAHCKLVDWERPLVDDPTYDLAHFLIPTTTQWKCGVIFTEAERDHFLAAYAAARPDLDPAELGERLRVRLPFILLRAIGWCAGAWVEYTGPGRAIDNRDTLAKIEEYLQEPYLRALFRDWLGDERSR